MWRRRATYDPMKAAAEGRKKQEEAKKAVQTNKIGDRYVSMYRGSFGPNYDHQISFRKHNLIELNTYFTINPTN